MRNKFTFESRKAKRKYYELKFKDTKGNMSATWKVINNLLGKKKKLSNAKFVSDGIPIPDHEIADNFNDYFVNAASNLLKESVHDGIVILMSHLVPNLYFVHLQVHLKLLILFLE